MLLLGILGYLVLLAGLASAMWAGTKLGAHWLAVPDFRWFDARPAHAAPWRRFGVRLASVLAPLGVCMAFFGLAYSLGGEPQPTTTVTVLAGPARDAGMVSGDRVVAIDGVPIDTWDALRASSKPGPERRIEIERGGARSVLRVMPSATGRIGVTPQLRNKALGFGGSLRRAVAQPFRIMSDAIRSLSPGVNDSVELRGPVGIVRETSKSAGGGAPALFMFLGSLGSYFWPQLLGLQLFDAATLLLFLSTHGAARQSERSAWRLARLQQALVLGLASLVVGTTLAGLDELHPFGGLGVPMILLATPAAIALFPLTWITGAQFWGRARSAAVVVPGIVVPCITPIAALALLIRARRELRGQGFRVGLLVSSELPAER